MAPKKAPADDDLSDLGGAEYVPTPSPSPSPEPDDLADLGGKTLAAKPPAPKRTREAVGQLESAARGFENGAALGLAPTLSGLLRAATQPAADALAVAHEKPTLGQALRAIATARGPTAEFFSPAGRKALLEDYRSGRDEAAQEAARAKVDNPGTYLGSTLGGGALNALATIPLSPFKAAAGANLLARMGASAANGALPGLIAGGAASDADVTREGLPGVGRVAKDALLGGLESAAFGAGLPVLGRVGSNALGAAKNFLNESSLNAVRRVLTNGSGQMAKNLKRVPDAVANFARDEGVQLFGTTHGAAERLKEAFAPIEQAYGEHLGAMEDAGFQGANAADVAGDVSKLGADYARNSVNSGVANSYRNIADELTRIAGQSEGGQLGLRQGEAVKKSVQDMVNYETAEARARNDALKSIASTIRQAQEDAVARQAESMSPQAQELAESFVPLKRQYGVAAQAADLAERGANKESRRMHGLSLHDLGSAGMALSGLGGALGGHTHEGLMGAALIAGAKLAGPRYQSTLAKLLQAGAATSGLGQALLATPMGQQALGRGGLLQLLGADVSPEEEAQARIQALRQQPEAQQP